MTKMMIVKLITITAMKYGVEPQVAVAVAAVESQFNPTVIGVTGDVGVFQLNPLSFPDYSVNQLKDPKLNIELGIKYLAKVKKECKHKDDINWLVCWNYGPKNAKKVKHPSLFPYVKKVTKVMTERSQAND